MEKDSLVITSENYKGYSELCKMKNFLDDKQTDEIVKKTAACLFAGFCVSFPVILITQYFYSVMFCVGLSGLSVFPLYSSIKKKSIDKVKKAYPYVNTEISNDLLNDALAKVGIAKIRNGVVEKIDTIEYENFIKVNRINSSDKVTSYNFVSNDINLNNTKEIQKVKKKVMNIDKRKRY